MIYIGECCARMEQLGPFHLFFTLSCAEMRWPSIIVEVLKTVLSEKRLDITYQFDAKGNWDGSWKSVLIYDGEKDENGKKKILNLHDYLDKYLAKSKQGLTDFLKEHFILITRIFDNRAKDFLNVVMKSKGIENYCYRIEFQMRGLPHVHGIGWLKKELIQHCLDENGLFREDEEGEKNVIEFIDKWISCSLNTGNAELDKIVGEVNIHKAHTKSCRKHGTDCRFNFPRPPSDFTIIAKPFPKTDDEEEKKRNDKKVELAKLVMTIVRQELTAMKGVEKDQCDDDLQKFLEVTCDLKNVFEEEHEVEFKKSSTTVIDKYHELLGISEFGKTVILKRKISERNVNNFNKTFLSIWNANSDIQLCLDSYAVVTYITDYLTKADKGLTKLLKTALNEKKDCEWPEQANHLKKTYFSSKQTCVSEATFRLIPGLNLKGSTVKSIFVSSGFREKRHMYLHQLEEKDEESSVPVLDDSSKVQIKGRAGQFIKPFSKDDKYSLRPQDDDATTTDEHGHTINELTTGILSAMSFAQFSMIYETKSIAEKEKVKKITWHVFGPELGGVGITTKEENRSPEDIEELPVLLKDLNINDDNPNGGKPFPQWIKLKGDEERYMKLRSVPYILRIFNGKRRDPLEDLYSELLLFAPWRNEEEINPWMDANAKDEDEDGHDSDVEDSREATIKKMSNKLKDKIEDTKRRIYPFSKKLDKIRELLENEDFPRSTHVYDSINPAAEQQNEDEEEDLEPLDTTDMFPETEEQPARRTRARKRTHDEMNSEKYVFKQPVLPEDRNEMYKNVRLLTFEQRVVFDKFIHFAKSLICFKNGGEIEAEPPRMIVHGIISTFM